MGMESMMAKIATKYGKIVDGKHNGAEVNLGCDPNKKVSAGEVPTHLNVIDGDEVKGRYVLGEDIVAVKWIAATANQVTIELKFNDGETATVELNPPKPAGFLAKLFKALSGAQVADPNTPEEKYRLIGAVLLTVCAKVADAPASETFDYLFANGYIKGDDPTGMSDTEKMSAVIKLAVDRFAVKVTAGNQNARR